MEVQKVRLTGKLHVYYMISNFMKRRNYASSKKNEKESMIGNIAYLSYELNQSCLFQHNLVWYEAEASNERISYYGISNSG